MPHIEQTDVLVVGAGPVGMLTALLLARNGIRTQIIDKESQTAGRSYACSLHPGTLELLERVGAAAEAVERGWRIDAVDFHQGGSLRTRLALSSLPARFPFALALEQSAFEDLLARKLAEARVKVEWRRQLEHLQEGRDGVTATVSKLAPSGRGYGVPDLELAVEKTYTVEAKYVVGADGSHSLVRQQLGIEFETAAEPERYTVFEIESRQPVGHEMLVALGGGGAVNVMWPLGARRRRWSFQAVSAAAPEDFPSKERNRFIFDESSGEHTMQQNLAQLLGERTAWRREDVGEVRWSAEVQFERRLARQFGRERCWLAGDAAHQTGPVGMQSMNMGLREAADLAQALQDVASGRGSPTALQDYDVNSRSLWRMLLWTDDCVQAPANAPDWVKARVSSIVESLPACGAEMANLLARLGLELHVRETYDNI